MKITGIVTEYNPFHKGHKYHLEKAKEDTNCDAIVAIMSGNFMQRGIPALTDKFTRAEMAVLNGVDLVLELPLVYSLSSAESFAYGAIGILENTKVIDNIYFGSESGDVEILKDIAKVLISEPPNYKETLKESLQKGLPFHLARMRALEKYFNNAKINEVLNNSNNILGIEYIKALLKLNSEITPFTLKREDSSYNESNLSTHYSSATSIRNYLHDTKNLEGLINHLPIKSYEVLDSFLKDGGNFTYMEDLFPYLKYKVLTNPLGLSKILDVSEGIDNKISKEINNSSSIDELILNVKSKRYTYTRINRILSSFYLGFENYEIKNLTKTLPNYIRPLAFNEKGRQVLKLIKEKDNIEIITKVPRKITNPYLEIDILGTKAYSILNPSVRAMEDFYSSPKVL